MPSTIRLILCDDQAIVTGGLQVILGTVPSFEVVAVAHDGAEAVDLVEEFSPDLVLMDLRMPIMNGIQATGCIRERFPETRVLVLTTYDEDGWVFDAIRAGADGYLLKDTPREDLIAASAARSRAAPMWTPAWPGSCSSSWPSRAPARRTAASGTISANGSWRCSACWPVG